MQLVAAQQVSDFLRTCAESAVVPTPVAAYGRDIKQLFGFAASAASRRGTCSYCTVRTFVAERHHRGLAGHSLQRWLSAVRAFYRYLLRNGAVAAIRHKV